MRLFEFQHMDDLITQLQASSPSSSSSISSIKSKMDDLITQLHLKRILGLETGKTYQSKDEVDRYLRYSKVKINYDRI